MDENEALSPEYSGSFLFLVDLAITFRKCGFYRDSKNITLLVQVLESLSLMLTGYYSKKPAENQKTEEHIRGKLIKIKDDMDKVLRDYEETADLQVPKKLWQDLYDLEQRLRGAWKSSGLQMSLKEKGGNLDNW